jgi:hypothetical protein
MARSYFFFVTPDRQWLLLRAAGSVFFGKHFPAALASLLELVLVSPCGAAANTAGTALRTREIQACAAIGPCEPRRLPLLQRLGSPRGEELDRLGANYRYLNLLTGIVRSWK